MMTPQELDDVILNVRERTGAIGVVMVVLHGSEDNEVCIVSEAAQVPNPMAAAMNVLKNAAAGQGTTLSEETYLGE